MIDKEDVPDVPTHSRYSEVNKSFDSFLIQKKAKESATPMAGRAQFFQNRIEEKATGKSAEYYHQMEHAMNEHKVYELSKVFKSLTTSSSIPYPGTLVNFPRMHVSSGLL